MNRYSLNSKSIGNGVSGLQKYIAAATAFVVNTSASFIRQVQLVSSTIVEDSTNATFTVYRYVQSLLNLVVNTATSVEVGLQHLASSSIVTGVNFSVYFLRITFFNVAATIRDSIVAGFGYIKYLLMAQPVEETAIAIPSIFGTYADDSRTIVVSAVDSLLDLDAQPRVIYIDGINAAIEVPPQDRSTGV